MGYDPRLVRSLRTAGRAVDVGSGPSWPRQQPFRLHRRPRRQLDRGFGGTGGRPRPARRDLAARGADVEQVGACHHAGLSMSGLDRFLVVLRLFGEAKSTWTV